MLGGVGDLGPYPVRCDQDLLGSIASGEDGEGLTWRAVDLKDTM